MPDDLRTINLAVASLQPDAGQDAAAEPLALPAHSARTQRLLAGPILRTLLGLAWPNVLVMLAQASSGLIETFWISRLGTDALAGMALVFPVVMLMQMISSGSLGGGISSAIARALGARRQEDADRLVLNAAVLSAGCGAIASMLVLAFGRSLYHAMGGEGGSLAAALLYSNVVFAGMVPIWLMNGLASVVRGTGNMLVPALVICGGVALLVPLSPVLIFGAGPIPALGIAGGGVAIGLYYLIGTAVLGWYILAGRSSVRARWTRLQWKLLWDILRVGGLSSINSLQVTFIATLTTALVAARLGTAAVAGYGTGARLEYLLIPLTFGLGAPLVAMVGANAGAGQQARALRIAFTGAAIAFALSETIGLAAALWPHAWLGLFGDDVKMIETGSTYLRIVGPFYGFYGGGVALFFASQGFGRLFWPTNAGLLRPVIAVGAGWLLLAWTGSLALLFAAHSLGLVAYGTMIAATLRRGNRVP